MKITKEEVEKLANSMMIHFDDNEVDSLIDSIANITSKLDELLLVEVDEQNYIHANDNVNVFNTNFSEEKDYSHILEKMNNFDGEYIRTGKVVSDEE